MYILSAIFLGSIYIWASSTFDKIYILKFLSFPIAAISLIALLIGVFLYDKKNKKEEPKESKKELEAKSTFFKWVYVHSYYGKWGENPFIAGFNTVYKERTYRPLLVTSALCLFFGGLLIALINASPYGDLTVVPISMFLAVIGLILFLIFYIYYKIKVQP